MWGMGESFCCGEPFSVALGETKRKLHVSFFLFLGGVPVLRAQMRLRLLAVIPIGSPK